MGHTMILALILLLKFEMIFIKFETDKLEKANTKEKKIMEQINNTLNIVEDLKGKLTDKEYKDLMDSLGEIQKVKKDTYVKFMSVTAVADIIIERDNGGMYGLEHERIISKKEGYDSTLLYKDSDEGELEKVDVKTSLECFPHIRKVIPDDEDSADSVECIPQSVYNKLKEDILLDLGTEVLVYLGDNE